MNAADQSNFKLNDLTDAEKHVIINKGTEKPFSGKYNDFFKPGIYLCRQCNAPLYCADDKFKTTCGWPGFDDEIPGAVKRIVDADGRRTEIICARCGAHLGHVFTGEELTPKNTRHCINSVSLQFVPDDSKIVQRAILGGGCFWGVEALIRKVPGVITVVSGYTGGDAEYPDYHQVCSGTTGHTEAVEVFFDPNKVSYEEILQRFFVIHDPQKLKKTQYQSAVFYLNEQQKKTAEKLIAELKTRKLNIVTVLKKAKRFYPAEGYHQNYYFKNGMTPQCHKL